MIISITCNVQQWTLSVRRSYELFLFHSLPAQHYIHVYPLLLEDNHPLKFSNIKIKIHSNNYATLNTSY